jgi:hypothetical protein
MAKLVVKKELLDQSIHYQREGSSYDVPLKDAPQEQLAILKELGMDIFEKDKKEQ